MNKGLEALDTMYGIALNGVLSQEENRLEECYNIIEKEHEDFEWLKSKIGIDFFYNLPTEDRVKLAEILGVKL